MPRVGLTFRHRRVLDGNNAPAVYVVTAIRNGVVYYRQPDETKSKECCDVDEWHRVCGQVLEGQQCPH